MRSRRVDPHRARPADPRRVGRAQHRRDHRRDVGPDAELDRLHERSQGNPFIAEELLVAGSDVDVPASLHDILLARASQIDADAEHLVRVAALLGRPVGHDLLAEASRLDDDAARRRRAAGGRAAGCSSSTPPREEYAFRHVLTQDAVRQRILPAERRRLHAAIAERARRATPTSQQQREPRGRVGRARARDRRPGRGAAGHAARRPAGRRRLRLRRGVAAVPPGRRPARPLDDESTLEPRVVLAEAAEAARWSGELDRGRRPRRARDQDVHRRPASAPPSPSGSGRYLVDAGRLDDAEAAFARADELAADVDDAGAACAHRRLVRPAAHADRPLPPGDPRGDGRAGARRRRRRARRARTRAHRARDEPGAARRGRGRRSSTCATGTSWCTPTAISTTGAAPTATCPTRC